MLRSLGEGGFSGQLLFHKGCVQEFCTLSELFFGKGFVYKKLGLVDAYGYFVLSIFSGAPCSLDL